MGSDGLLRDDVKDENEDEDGDTSEGTSSDDDDSESTFTSQEASILEAALQHVVSTILIVSIRCMRLKLSSSTETKSILYGTCFIYLSYLEQCMSLWPSSPKSRSRSRW